MNPIRAAEAECGPAHLDAVLEDLTRNSGILQRLSNGRFTFLHASFQDYFAAGAIAAPDDARTRTLPLAACGEFIDRKAWDMTNWESLILFLAGQMADPGPLLDRLSDESRDDRFRHRLALAEIPAMRRESCRSRINAITTEAWNFWWSRMLNNIEGVVAHLACALPALVAVRGEIRGRVLLDHLVDRLADPDWSVRGAAARAVEALGAPAATAAILDHLARLLADPYSDVRSAAVGAVRALDRDGDRCFRVEPVVRRIGELSHWDGPDSSIELSPLFGS